MNDYPPEYDQEILDNQYFAEAFPDAASPAELYRQVYKYTDCGAWLSVKVDYIEVIEPDGFNDYPSEIERSKWIHSGELHKLGTWADMDERGELVTALMVGSIVEGVDQTTDEYEIEAHQTDEEPKQFRARFDAALDQVEQEAESIWNDTHGCESCAAHFNINMDEEYSPIWKDCPDCNGHGEAF